ncbi:MAG: FAD-dependent oxidoreductase, partial [Microthrixaceae bacterium]|nr:FAD-dependent oxidoreductase [Microthrixaceae bacterium]
MVVVGAGPCGLGCGRELEALGHDDFELIESSMAAGGLAASVVDPVGFTWDRGGHVVFSHYGEFDRLLDEVMAADLLTHDRSSFIRVADRWVPYPFQNHLHHLPVEHAEAAIVGLIEAHSERAIGSPADDFGSWMQTRFGAGICEQFMVPYNRKVWAHPASDMSARWVAERVSTVDWRTALRCLLRGVDAPGWGPNDRFAFPRHGGTGEVYRRAADRLDGHIGYGLEVRAVDPVRRIVTTGDGAERGYNSLVWTGALDQLITMLTVAPAPVRAAAAALVYTSVVVVGIGYESPLTDDRSWLYFPGTDVPFYRATNFAKYAAANVPGGDTDRYSSWMCEVSSSATHPTAGDDALVDRVDAALRTTGVVAPDAPVVSRHLETLPYAYPVPTRGRDRALRTLLPW